MYSQYFREGGQSSNLLYPNWAHFCFANKTVGILISYTLRISVNDSLDISTAFINIVSITIGKTTANGNIKFPFVYVLDRESQQNGYNLTYKYLLNIFKQNTTLASSTTLNASGKTHM